MDTCPGQEWPIVDHSRPKALHVVVVPVLKARLHRATAEEARRGDRAIEASLLMDPRMAMVTVDDPKSVCSGDSQTLASSAPTATLRIIWVELKVAFRRLLWKVRHPIGVRDNFTVPLTETGEVSQDAVDEMTGVRP